MQPQTSRSRLLSLDVLRGLTVMGMILVNATAAMPPPVFPFLQHVSWVGLNFADLVFPAFLMMVGVSIPLSLGTAKARGGLDRAQGLKIVWRTLRLFVIGVLLSNLWFFMDMAQTEWRFWGVLQRIALVYGVCALIFFKTSPRAWLIIAAIILVLYWPLVLIPSPDGLPVDIGVRGHNFAAYVDRALLENHIYVKGPQGYDPEGWLGTLPAIAQGLIGMAAGQYLTRAPVAEGARRLAVAGLCLLVAGSLWSLVFPVIKDIWSGSFVLVTSGITLLCLAGLHAWLDGGAPPKGLSSALVTVPASFGINAFAAYILHALASFMLGWQVMRLPYDLAEPVIGAQAAAMLPVLIFLAIIWAAMDYLRRQGWVVRV